METRPASMEGSKTTLTPGAGCIPSVLRSYPSPSLVHNRPLQLPFYEASFFFCHKAGRQASQTQRRRDETRGEIQEQRQVTDQWRWTRSCRLGSGTSPSPWTPPPSPPSGRQRRCSRNRISIPLTKTKRFAGHLKSSLCLLPPCAFLSSLDWKTAPCGFSSLMMNPDRVHRLLIDTAVRSSMDL